MTYSEELRRRRIGRWAEQRVKEQGVTFAQAWAAAARTCACCGRRRVPCSRASTASRQTKAREFLCAAYADAKELLPEVSEVIDAPAPETTQPVAVEADGIAF